MKQKVLKAGYTIKEFKVSGSCYEIYGKDARGNNVEIYFDPTVRTGNWSQKLRRWLPTIPSRRWARKCAF